MMYEFSVSEEAVPINELIILRVFITKLTWNDVVLGHPHLCLVSELFNGTYFGTWDIL